MTYQPGETVDILIKGARVLNCDGGSLVYEYSEGARTDREEVQYKFGAVEITRLVPAEGPPKAGELWEDADGVRYLAVEWSGRVLLHSGRPGASGYDPGYLHHNYGPIRRVLSAGQDEQGEPDEHVAACVVCGCTEDDACIGGCSWVPNGLMVDLCSACVHVIATLAGGDA